MKEVKVFTLSLFVCVIGMLASFWDTNLLGIIGFGMALIGHLGSRWYFVQWERAGRPEDNSSFL